MKYEIKDKEDQCVNWPDNEYTAECVLLRDKEFFKTLIATISVEANGICIWEIDLNVIKDYDQDTTSFKRSKKPITKLLKKAWKEIILLMFGETNIPCRGTVAITQQHTLFTPELIISL